MKHEDYKQKRDEEVKKIIEQPSYLDKQSMYKLFYILSPITTAQIFWDAFEATQNSPNPHYNRYAQNLMMACKSFFDVIGENRQEIRTSFNHEVNRLMDKSMLNLADKEQLLSGKFFDRLDNLKDY